MSDFGSLDGCFPLASVLCIILGLLISGLSMAYASGVGMVILASIGFILAVFGIVILLVSP